MEPQSTLNRSVRLPHEFAAARLVSGLEGGLWLRQAPFALLTLAVLALAWLA